MTVNALKERVLLQGQTCCETSITTSEQRNELLRVKNGIAVKTIDNWTSREQYLPVWGGARREMYTYVMDEPVEKHTEEILEPGGMLTFR